MAEDLHIPLSKKKMRLSLFGAIIFVGYGISLFIFPPDDGNPIFSNPVLISIVGALAISFFGWVAITVIRKLVDRNAGLIITKKGIIDNSSGIPAGVILWSDIQDIKVSSILNQKFIMLIVKNPQDYIKRERNLVKKKALQFNYKNYGSPVALSAGLLKIKFDHLKMLLTHKKQEYS